VTEAGAPLPAPRDLLRGCDLPSAWADAAQWRILATGWRDGLDFLAAWRAWKDDPRRPRILHFVALAQDPPTDDAFVLTPAGDPSLLLLATQLAADCHGLLPGVHRLVFERGHVLLTLCVGEPDRMLRQLDFHAESVFLTGPVLAGNEATTTGVNPKALARCCRRGTRICAADSRSQQAAALRRHGFVFEASPPAPGPGLLQGRFAPAWEPRGPKPQPAVVPGDCLVIGAGLAGAAVAASMARRGWRVRVLDAANVPASGASGLPAGLLVPHTSPDDNLLSRLSRAGVRATLQQARELLECGHDWAPSGVLEHHLDGAPGEAAATGSQATAWSRPADPLHKASAGLDASVPADWHEIAAWVQPAQLVGAWLAQPGIELQTGAQVADLRLVNGRWCALDAAGATLAQGDRVVVAAAFGSETLLPGLALQPVRGQVTWAPYDAQLAPHLPPFPVNGDGSFIPSVPTSRGLAWVCGASFERGAIDLAPRESDQQANLARMRRLLPAVAAQLDLAIENGAAVQAWTGIRCASRDRRPLVGPIDERALDGPWVCTAMGSRGLTFAALSAELIAARIHGEPLPLPRKLAQALSPGRQKNAAAARASTGE
jgi:tRNA 5-methylaminomethyl-2-thiouridine biosynthesis bifunctional protein